MFSTSTEICPPASWRVLVPPPVRANPGIISSAIEGVGNRRMGWYRSRQLFDPDAKIALSSGYGVISISESPQRIVPAHRARDRNPIFGHRKMRHISGIGKRISKDDDPCVVSNLRPCGCGGKSENRQNDKNARRIARRAGIRHRLTSGIFERAERTYCGSNRNTTLTLFRLEEKTSLQAQARATQQTKPPWVRNLHSGL